MRGQANLPALAVALLVVTTAAGLSVTLADGAFGTAERDAADRATAEALADRLVAADSPVTERRNVLDGGRLDEPGVEPLVPPGADVRVVLDGEPVYERGDPTGGQTVRRLVLVADRQVVTLEPPLAFGETTLPRRSPVATIDVAVGAEIETVRANDRVVLHDPSGLGGSHEVALSRYETTTFRFEDDPEPDDVTITYYPRQTVKAELEVTVDGY